MAERLIDAGANTPKADDTVKWFLETERLKGKVDEATGKLRAHLKLGDERGIDLKAVAMLRKLRKMDTDEAASLMGAVQRYGRWLQVPLFTQGALFADVPADAGPSEKVATELAEQQAWDAGKAAGKSGVKAGDNPHEPGSALGQRWGQGWASGQASIAASLTDDPAQKAATMKAVGTRRPGRRAKSADAAGEDFGEGSPTAGRA